MKLIHEVMTVCLQFPLIKGDRASDFLYGLFEALDHFKIPKIPFKAVMSFVSYVKVLVNNGLL